MWAIEPFRGRIVSRRDGGGTLVRKPGFDDGPAFDVGRDGESQECEDGRGGVGEIGLEMAAEGQIGAGEGDDAFRTMDAGEIGIGLDPGVAGGQLGPDPVGFVGQRDEVGLPIACAAHASRRRRQAS